MENLNKKILIISHNPLSRVSNNGKTLASIFEGVPKENIYQIYLNSDIPDYSEDCHYLQINEKQIISSFVKMKNVCCQEVKSTTTKVVSTSIKMGSFAIHIKRLIREMIWKISFWKSNLKSWLLDKKFDVVFFMAGDGIFAYDVYRFVLEHTLSKGCLFFTDDYLIGKNSFSPVALFRQFLLKRKVTKTLKRTDKLFVISDEMKEAYRSLLGIEGYVIRNFSVEKKQVDYEECEVNEHSYLQMVYAGGLHYNRWKVLSQIAKVLKKINDSGNIKCQLRIYSAQNISTNIIDEISIESVSLFCGSASADQIAEIYASADILVHVESFENKAIASTKYSFSTKIPEYLSSGKAVLAVGPEEVASIRYLSDFACVICDDSSLYEMLGRLINDEVYRSAIRTNCEQRYEEDFSPEKQKECLNYILSSC